MQQIEKLDPNFARPDPEKGLLWYDIRALGVEGRGFDDTKAFYDRLPARAEGVVPDPVWQLSHMTTGMRVRFVTNATSVSVRWKLTLPELAMPHMPATGVSGFDLYADHEGTWRYVGVARPRHFPNDEYVLEKSMSAVDRHYLMHLPIYNGVEEVSGGISKDASIAKAPAYPENLRKPLVVYGGSVVQGSCASRPGMTYPNILGRRLRRTAINMGVSGNGRAEVEMARFLGEIDAAAYVIDTLGNMDEPMIRERMVPFVTALRTARPKAPIVLVEHFFYPADIFVPWMKLVHDGYNRELADAFAKLTAAGVDNIHLLKGDHLYGHDGDCTVDGTHPTDLGFSRIADAQEPLLRSLLGA